MRNSSLIKNGGVILKIKKTKNKIGCLLAAVLAIVITGNSILAMKWTEEDEKKLIQITREYGLKDQKISKGWWEYVSSIVFNGKRTKNACQIRYHHLTNGYKRNKYLNLDDKSLSDKIDNPKLNNDSLSDDLRVAFLDNLKRITDETFFDFKY